MPLFRVDAIDFVRITPSVNNASPDVHCDEAWLTMMFPITTESTTLSRQHVRWRRDNWCFEDRSNMLTRANHAADLSCPHGLANGLHPVQLSQKNKDRFMV